MDGKLDTLTRSRAANAAYERAHLDTFDRLREDQIVITTEALSQVEDADYVSETANLVEGQILSKAAIQALAFSNREQVEQIEELIDSLNDD